MSEFPEVEVPRMSLKEILAVMEGMAARIEAQASQIQRLRTKAEAYDVIADMSRGNRAAINCANDGILSYQAKYAIEELRQYVIDEDNAPEMEPNLAGLFDEEGDTTDGTPGSNNQ